MFFSNGSSARPLVDDTVARGTLQDDTAFFTGKSNGAEVDTLPFPLTADVLDRGEQRFNIYCSPCHDVTGSGRGMIVRRGYKQPPSYHIDRLRQIPIGHFYDVMTNGFGAMPDYRAQIAPRDRWAIAAYIRALQLSQHAPAGGRVGSRNGRSSRSRRQAAGARGAQAVMETQALTTIDTAGIGRLQQRRASSSASPAWSPARSASCPRGPTSSRRRG